MGKTNWLCCRRKSKNLHTPSCTYLLYAQLHAFFCCIGKDLTRLCVLNKVVVNYVIVLCILLSLPAMHEDSEDNFVYAIVDPGPNIRLASEPNANTSVIRDRARATHDIAAGSLILTSEPSATALLLSEKGKRCDFCHTQLQSVLRCKGCASYYYCDRACQFLHLLQSKHLY